MAVAEADITSSSSLAALTCVDALQAALQGAQVLHCLCRLCRRIRQAQLQLTPARAGGHGGGGAHRRHGTVLRALQLLPDGGQKRHAAAPVGKLHLWPCRQQVRSRQGAERQLLGVLNMRESSADGQQTSRLRNPTSHLEQPRPTPSPQHPPASSASLPAASSAPRSASSTVPHQPASTAAKLATSWGSAAARVSDLWPLPRWLATAARYWGSGSASAAPPLPAPAAASPRAEANLVAPCRQERAHVQGQGVSGWRPWQGPAAVRAAEHNTHCALSRGPNGHGWLPPPPHSSGLPQHPPG